MIRINGVKIRHVHRVLTRPAPGGTAVIHHHPNGQKTPISHYTDSRLADAVADEIRRLAHPLCMIENLEARAREKMFNREAQR